MRWGRQGAGLGRCWVRSHLGQDDSVLEAKGRDGLVLAGNQETGEAAQTWRVKRKFPPSHPSQLKVAWLENRGPHAPPPPTSPYVSKGNVVKTLLVAVLLHHPFLTASPLPQATGGCDQQQQDGVHHASHYSNGRYRERAAALCQGKK